LGALLGLLASAWSTSIDALAAGVTLPLLEAPLVVRATTIGVTTALLSALGMIVGRRLGHALGPGLERLGGAALVALGVKALVVGLRDG
jgi:putative Mn2+ efflux pump MntP